MQPPQHSSTVSVPAGVGVLLAVALGIAAACLVLLRQTEFGPGLTPDSAAYVSTARNLYAGEGLVPVYGRYAYWPPLFPIIIAVTGIVHDDMIASAAVVNAVAFGLTVFVVAAWLRRYRVSPLLVAWAGLALALSPAAGVAAYVWSESVFVLFVLAALSALDRFLTTGARGALLVSAGFAALCCITRYAGATVLMCAVALIAMRTTLAPTRRIRAAVLYAAVGFAPTALWIVRNLLVLGYPIGDRSHYHQQFSASATFGMVVETTLNATVGPKVLDWIDGRTAPAADGGAAIDGKHLASLLAVWGLVGCGLARRSAAGLWPAAAVAGGFLLCYLAFLAVASPLGELGPEPRFVVPLNAPMLVVLALTLHACHTCAWSATAAWDGKSAAWCRWLVRSAMMAAPLLWLAQWAAPNVMELRQWATYGSDGYGARRWSESEMSAHLKSTTFDGLLISNDPFAVYLLTGGGTAGHRSGNHLIDRLWEDIPPATDVVWFHAPRVPRSTDLMAFLAAFPNMRLIAAHADGVIFRQGEREGVEGADDAATQLAEVLLRRGQEGVLVAASYFDVYLDAAGKRLTYARYGCAPADVGARFFLHVTPEDPAKRRFSQRHGRWRQRPVGFHNFDFWFAPRGVYTDGLCVATIALPSFDIAQIRTGQWPPGPRGTIWSATFAVPPG